MAGIAGPNLVTAGLVLCLDKYNEKSYLGEPTTNYFLSETWWGDGSDQGFASKGYTVVTDSNLKYKELPTVLWTPGASLNCYLNGSSDIPSGESSANWQFSCYVKREDGGVISSMQVYMYFPVSDGSAAGTIESVGNGWYRISRMVGGTSAPISLAGFTGMASSIKYYLSGWQLEKNTRMTKAIPYNTSRSATDGWQDLTGNENHADLNLLTYTSTNVPGTSTNDFSYDGVDDYVTRPNFQIGNGSRRTFSCWAKFDSLTSNNLINMTANANNYKWQYFQVNNGTMYFMFGDNSFYNERGYSTAVVATTGVWYNFVVTVDTGLGTGNSCKLYVNGESTAVTYDNNSLATIYDASDMHLYIGNSNWTGSMSTAMDGEISIASIYDRALTVAEVKQNFESYKGRFGL